MTDPEVSLLLHCAAWRGLRQSHVRVELSERYNRQTDAALQRHIEEVWTARVSKEPWLFDGAKFRLHSTASAPLLTLRLGLTSYKDYLGTNWSSRAVELHKRGEAEFGSSQALLAQPLGVGAVVCTGDGQVVFIRRSQEVAEAGGKLDLPGGHPEPKRSGGSPESLTKQKHRWPSHALGLICQQVNIPLSSLGEPLLMGMILNHTSAGRPSAEFYISCSLSSDKIRELYWKGGAEANESTDIVFLTAQKNILTTPLWQEMCPSAKGAVLLFQTVKPKQL
uniref:Nudix (nucleoside diphosphate linked moiety X)-type motif 22 n=1 Tax=Hippocampus comes TaxID=109280 RepID=A0A3Q2Z913_HIPCM